MPRQTTTTIGFTQLGIEFRFHRTRTKRIIQTHYPTSPSDLFILHVISLLLSLIIIPLHVAPDGRCFPVARSVTLFTLFNLADRNRFCLNGGTPNDVQAGQWQTSFSGRGDAHLRRTVNKFQRPSILQLNIEGLTASKMSVLHHLALQCEALVILLQETHCTSVERLDLPSYHLAGFSLSRKHGLATFVHERLK